MLGPDSMRSSDFNVKCDFDYGLGFVPMGSGGGDCVFPGELKLGFLPGGGGGGFFFAMTDISEEAGAWVG
jgi:hypothetical protein